MIRYSRCGLIALAGVMVSISWGHARDSVIPVPFSAEVVFTAARDGMSQAGRYYAASQGLRWEMEEDGVTMVTIVRFEPAAIWLLMPRDRAYVELPGFDDPDAVMPGRVRPSPCGEEAAATRLGSEAVDDREAQLWQCGQDDKAWQVWFDGRLQLPIREQDADGSRYELRNINEGPQAADLFRLPDGYRKLEMPVVPR